MLKPIGVFASTRFEVKQDVVSLWVCDIEWLQLVILVSFSRLNSDGNVSIIVQLKRE